MKKSYLILGELIGIILLIALIVWFVSPSHDNPKQILVQSAQPTIAKEDSIHIRVTGLVNATSLRLKIFSSIDQSRMMIWFTEKKWEITIQNPNSLPQRILFCVGMLSGDLTQLPEDIKAEPIAFYQYLESLHKKAMHNKAEVALTHTDLEKLQVLLNALKQKEHQAE